MAKIKGWTKNTKRSWRNDYNSNIISYSKNRNIRTNKPVYGVLTGRSIAEIRVIAEFDTKEKAVDSIMNYMRSHPNG